MSFKITRIIRPQGITVGKIFLTLNKTLSKSRFTARVENHLDSLSIHDVRLLKSKDYCGNHPLPCPVRPGVHKPHVHSKCLEGADWVAFNDMLNDVLDKLKVSANVASSLVIIRKGRMRCVRYDSKPFSGGIGNEWIKDSECFQDNIGVKSPRSMYPAGTPGIPEYKA